MRIVQLNKLTICFDIGVDQSTREYFDVTEFQYKQHLSRYFIFYNNIQ